MVEGADRPRFVGQDAPKPLAELVPGPVETAADRADRDVQDLGDLLVRHPLQVLQDHDRPMVALEGIYAFWIKTSRSACSIGRLGSELGESSAGSPPGTSRGAHRRWLAFRLLRSLSVRFTAIR